MAFYAHKHVNWMSSTPVPELSALSSSYLADRHLRATIICMWPWQRTSFGGDFPEGFTVQRIGIADAMAIAELPPDLIAAYLRKNPAIADRLLTESYDKRYSPSTFITEQGDGYLVGWLSARSGYQSQRRFSNLADAATDYLLFSLGKGRWAEPANSN